MRTASIVRAALPLFLLAGCGMPRSGGSGRPDMSPDEPVDRSTQIASLQQRSIEDPTNPHWLFRLGEVHVEAGDVAAAESSLRFALQRDPTHAPSLSLLSKLWWDAHRYGDAVSILESARATAGTLPPELMTALALHYDAMDRPDLAASILRLIEHDADWAKEGSALAYVRLRGEDFVDSEDVARRALEADPESAVNHNNYGIAKLYAGKPEEARKSFLTALDLDPALPGPLYNLAIVDRFYRFDEKSAQKWFRQYRELSDDDPDGLAEILATEMVADSSLPDTEESAQ